MQSIRTLLANKKKKSGLKRPLEIYELFSVWTHLTQDLLRGKKPQAAPRALKGKTLIVEVGSAPVAAELRFRQYHIIKKLNAHFGRKLVERVVFRLNA